MRKAYFSMIGVTTSLSVLRRLSANLSISKLKNVFRKSINFEKVLIRKSINFEYFFFSYFIERSGRGLGTSGRPFLFRYRCFPCFRQTFRKYKISKFQKRFQSVRRTKMISFLPLLPKYLETEENPRFRTKKHIFSPIFETSGFRICSCQPITSNENVKNGFGK